MSLVAGTRIEMADDGEGWFAGLNGSPLTGSVMGVISSQARPGDWHVVLFDQPLEVQEKGGNTPSGLQLVRYAQAVIAVRMAGDVLGREGSTPCYLCLVRDGDEAPTNDEELAHYEVRAWSRCRVLASAA